MPKLQQPGPTEDTSPKYITIGKNFRIGRDNLQFIVERRVVPRGKAAKNAERWVLFGYYPKMHMAYQALIDAHVLESDIVDLTVLIYSIQEAKQAILKHMEEHGYKPEADNGVWASE